MTAYVVDASVVIQGFIRDTYSQQVRMLFEGLMSGDQLHVPEFCLVECTNVLWKLARFHRMPPEESVHLVRDLVALPMIIVPAASLLTRALEIGLSHQLAIYDSTYIALAERLTYPLITGDQRQELAARAIGITTRSIADFQ